ncbi:MAG: hypothetical protein AAF664_05015 [Planctomycetota bacterium]
MVQRLLQIVSLGIVLATCLHGQSTLPASDSSGTQVGGSASSDTASLPLVAEPLPGTSQTRLTTPDRYVSSLVSLFNADQSTSSARQLSRYYQSRSRSNVLRIPEMFGDFRSPGNQALVTLGTFNSLSFELPVAAGIGGLRIAEDNQALPADRFWFAYNHFDDGLQIDANGQGATPSNDQSLNRFIIAREFLLDEGRTSLEVRLPFGSAINVSDNAVTGLAGGAYRLDSDSIGNLSFILKRLLYGDGCMAVSTGLGVETPTGSSASFTTADINITQEVDSVHLVPFIAASERVHRWFGHAFAQLDIPIGDDPIVGRLSPVSAITTLAEIEAAPQLGLDIGLGYWLKPKRCESDFGLAAIAELHLTTGLGDADSATAVDGPTTLFLNNPVSVSDDLLNATFGVIASPGTGWSIRSAIVTPLRSQRVFDVEAIVQLNRTL